MDKNFKDRLPIDKIDDVIFFLIGAGLIAGAWMGGDQQLAADLSKTIMGALIMYLKGK